MHGHGALCAGLEFGHVRRAAYVATCLQTAQRRLMKALANAISEGGLIKVEHLYLHGNNISDEGIE
eukprot:scaffold223065_cov32-Tisochrysis_lutea.AAC.1